MNDILRPGAGILFMKVGTHAQEPLEEIIARKRREIDDAGYALWGYGGSTCHPRTMVQPFAKSFARRGGTIYLCMEEMQSNHFADQVRAEQSSVDGLTWEDIPPAVNVRGSRYALRIKALRRESFELPLSHTRVAVGNCQGRAGDLYISGRVDKACLEIADPVAPTVGEERKVAIGLVAEIESPYAVFLRNRPKL